MISSEFSRTLYFAVNRELLEISPVFAATYWRPASLTRQRRTILEMILPTRCPELSLILPAQTVITKRTQAQIRIPRSIRKDLQNALLPNEPNPERIEHLAILSAPPRDTIKSSASRRSLCTSRIFPTSQIM